MPKYYVYTLDLEYNKVYVGATNNLTRRYRQHCTGRGANYTRKFKPIRIAAYSEIIAHDFDEVKIYEDARALEVIFKIGIKRARGGRFFTRNIRYNKLVSEYESIGSQYKNIPTVDAVGRPTSLVEMKRPRSKKKKDYSTWLKQVEKAKKQLAIANKNLAIKESNG